jgi:hypothetical protein
MCTHQEKSAIRFLFASLLVIFGYVGHVSADIAPPPLPHPNLNITIIPGDKPACEDAGDQKQKKKKNRGKKQSEHGAVCTPEKHVKR